MPAVPGQQGSPPGPLMSSSSLGGSQSQLNTSSGNLDNSQLHAMQMQQQMFQRAFLQSAFTQNMQIQQQLMAQNQALAQMLSVSLELIHDQGYVLFPTDG